MPDLAFTVEGAEVAPFAAAPLLLFKLHACDTANTPSATRSRASRCNARFRSRPRTPLRAAEQERLADLFGKPAALGRNAAHDAMDPHDAWCHRSTVNARSICPCRAATISMWPPPSISAL